MLMVAAAVAMAPLTLATLLFLLTLGLSGALKAALAGGLAAAAGILLFTALLMLACVARSRALVALSTLAIALADRDATVGLLLHEHQGATSDWL